MTRPRAADLTEACRLFASRFFPEAAKEAHRAVQLAPGSPEAHMMLGASLLNCRRFKEAEASLRRAVVLNPKFALAHYNLANVLHHNLRFDEAREHYATAAELGNPQLKARVANSLAGMLLSLGRFSEGWDIYDQRHDVSGPTPYARQLWRGEGLAEKSLLIWPEFGWGDQIQFARYVSILAAMGAHITLACAQILRPLFATLEGPSQVVTDMPEGAYFDYWTPLLSIPGHLRTDLASIPAQVPYLRADPSRVAAWATKLPAGFRVGIAWRGSPTYENDHNRSLESVDILRPLWNVPGAQFISLQMGAHAIIDTPPDQPLHQLGRAINDFADAAAIISQLDLFVSVDTAYVHLAGALNKPCFVLLPRAGTDWRWLRDRDDSPWYPSLRLFRQGADFDWHPTVCAAAIALRAAMAT